VFFSTSPIVSLYDTNLNKREKSLICHSIEVATDEGDDRKVRLICIYTKDFSDMQDVGRVVRKMRDLGLIETRKAIYYKCDAYTYLGLNSQNEYEIKASLYSSVDVLKSKDDKKDQKLEGFFYKKKKDTDDWRALEWE